MWIATRLLIMILLFYSSNTLDEGSGDDVEEQEDNVALILEEQEDNVALILEEQKQLRLLMEKLHAKQDEAVQEIRMLSESMGQCTTSENTLAAYQSDPIVDPCAEGNHECSEFATCTAASGSYWCSCQTGYSGDGFTCEVIIVEEYEDEELTFISPMIRSLTLTTSTEASSTKRWRDDYRCGSSVSLPDGYPAECNPTGRYPCCSPHTWCGITPEHCSCDDCIDYRRLCPRGFIYIEGLDCIHLTESRLTWQEANDRCKKNESYRLLEFSSKKELTALKQNFFEKPLYLWVGLKDQHWLSTDWKVSDNLWRLGERERTSGCGKVLLSGRDFGLGLADCQTTAGSLCQLIRG